MKEYIINPNKAMFLYDTGDGWEIAKLGEYKLCVNDDVEIPYCYFVINHSLFYRSDVPKELLEQIQRLIPTDEQLDNIEWQKKHQKDIIDYGKDMCSIRIEH